MNWKKTKYDQFTKTNIDIKKEIALSILNIGEILTKTIDYYSLKDRQDDLIEFIEICNQQTKKEKNGQSSYQAYTLEDSIDNNYNKNSILKSVESQKSISKYFDKMSSYSLNHLIQDIDQKIKVLNGIFCSNEYINFNKQNNGKEKNYELCQMKTLTKSDTFSYLNESMELFEEMKELNEIMNDLNLIVDKNEKKLLNYGSFV